MAQTAVDYLVKKFHDYGTLYYSDITEAKEMEKEQIDKAYISGGYAGLHFPFTKDAFDRKYLQDKFTEYYKTNYNNGL